MLDEENNAASDKILLNNIVKINKEKNKGKNIIKENNKSFTNNQTNNFNFPTINSKLRNSSLSQISTSLKKTINQSSIIKLFNTKNNTTKNNEKKIKLNKNSYNHFKLDYDNFENKYFKNNLFHNKLFSSSLLSCTKRNYNTFLPTPNESLSDVRNDNKYYKFRSKKILLKKMIQSNLENNNKKMKISSKIKLLSKLESIKKYKSFTYYIKEGNNGKLIEKCLQTRENFIPVSKESYANLIWTPLSCDIDFKNLENKYQYINHLEYHNELSNKMKLFFNLIHYCELNDIDLFSFFPLTIIFQFEDKSFNKQLNGFKQLYSDIPNLLNYSTTLSHYYKFKAIDKVYSDYCSIKLSSQIGNLQRMEIPHTHYNGRNIWIIKPINLNRGRNIKVLCELKDIVNEIKMLNETKHLIIDDDESNKKRKIGHLIVQKYIECPLLYKGRKFDIRIWVLFIFKDEKLSLYVFKEGHLKATCDRFDINSSNIYIHLTNYSIQKNNSNFSKEEIGNEISFQEFQNDLNNNEKIKVNFYKDIFPKICNIIKITGNSVKTRINLSNKNNCFEIFGYDFIIDSNYNPFLLEVNTNPGFEESSPLIKILIPRMIDDAFKLTIDTLFKIEDTFNKNSSFPVNGYKDDENMWLKLKLK